MHLIRDCSLRLGCASLGKHVRGIPLYGPPGWERRPSPAARRGAEGARAQDHPGPRGAEPVRRCFEEAIRDLFKDAEKEQEEAGENSGLHVIIMDEIDAICKARVQRRQHRRSDNIVNQLLPRSMASTRSTMCY